MNGSASTPRPSFSDAAAIRQQLERILASPGFAASERRGRLLKYLVEKALAGEPTKEYSIGVDVFEKPADYDPRVDPSVRVEIGRLRTKLSHYYADANAGAVHIQIPKGSYVPIFEGRQAAALEDEAEPAGWKQREPACAAWTEPQWAAMRDLWGPFFPRPDHELTVVTADASFALWQDLAGQTLSLGEYLSRNYFSMGDPHLREIAARRCVAPADLNISLRLVEVADAFGGAVKACYARNLSMADLRTGPAVLIGSRRSNPWVQLFERHLNFVLALDPPPGGPRFENKAPGPGEPAAFSIPCRFDIDGTERTEMEAYALVALVPNLSDRGHVLLLEGLNMEGTDAAGDCVTNPERLAALLRQLGHKPGTPVRPFEALLKLTSIPGGYADPAVIAFRQPFPAPVA